MHLLAVLSGCGAVQKRLAEAVEEPVDHGKRHHREDGEAASREQVKKVDGERVRSSSGRNVAARDIVTGDVITSHVHGDVAIPGNLVVVQVHLAQYRRSRE